MVEYQNFGIMKEETASGMFFFFFFFFFFFLGGGGREGGSWTPALPPPPHLNLFFFFSLSASCHLAGLLAIPLDADLCAIYIFSLLLILHNLLYRLYNNNNNKQKIQLDFQHQ